MVLQMSKEVLELLGATVRAIDRLSIWGAKSMLRLIGSLLSLAAIGVLLLALATDYFLITSAEDYQLRKGPQNSNAEDDRFLVAQEAIAACDDADKAKRNTAKKACIEARTRYEHAMVEMSPDLLKERLKTATFSNWLLDVNQALRLQRAKRASRGRATLVERIQSWTSNYWGYAVLTAILVVLPIARLAWVTNNEKEKLSRKAVRPHLPIRRNVPTAPRQRAHLRKNRSRQAIAV